MANPDKWYKRDPQAYIQDTRHLPWQVRAVYSEFIDRQRLDERPLPHDLNWLACAFHMPRGVIKRGIERLMADGFVLLSPAGGLVNPKCMTDIAGRLHQREVNTQTARTRSANRKAAEITSKKDGQNSDKTSSGNAREGSETRNLFNDDAGISFNETGHNEEVKREDRRDSSPTPHGVGRGGFKVSADDQHRQAYLDGQRIKQGVATKSARAAQRCTGELDGSRGILFVGGKLSVDGPALDELRADFPGVDINAACNRAGADLAGRRNYPSYDQAMAELRKAADIIRSVRQVKAAAGATEKRSLTREEELDRTEEILASDEAYWNCKRYGAAGPHQPGCLITEPHCLERLKLAFDKQNRRIRRADIRSFNKATHPAAGAEVPF